jgi:transposase
MVNANDDVTAETRHVEVLTRPSRRPCSAKEEALIVPEARTLGASVSAVARRWQVSPLQVLGGPRRAPVEISESSGRPAVVSLPPFVPLLAKAAPPETVAVSGLPSAKIEINLAGAAVRVVPGVDGDLLTIVLRAVRGSGTADRGGWHPRNHLARFCGMLQADGFAGFDGL